MTELYEPFSGDGGAFKSSGEKLIPIHNLLPWKRNKSVGCDVVRSYEWLILLETKYWYVWEDVELVVLDCCMDLIVPLWHEKVKAGHC